MRVSRTLILALVLTVALWAGPPGMAAPGEPAPTDSSPERVLQQAREAQQRVEQLVRAQTLDAARYRALAHQEKSLALLEQGRDCGDNRDLQRALLHALQAQRQPLADRPGLQPRALSAWAGQAPGNAFALRWRSTAAWLGGPVASLAWSPDGTRLATTGADGNVRLWDAATGQLRRRLPGAGRPVLAVAFSRDGQQLAASDAEGDVWLWRLDGDEARLPARLQGHRGRVTSIAFNPNGSRLASGAFDGHVRPWDVASGQERARLAGEAGRLFSVAFSRDGKRLAAGTGDGVVRLWDLRLFLLLHNGPAPSPRAALLAEALQRGWRLRLDDVEATPELWTRLESGKGGLVDSAVTVDVRPAAATVEPGNAPIWRTFDLRPLFAPPAPGQDKLDQLLAWLVEQESRLRP